MQKLDSWVRTHVQTFNKKKISQMSNSLFFREEMRPTLNDEAVFLAPADGVVIGVKEANIFSNDVIIENKGIHYTLKDSIGNDVNTIKYLERIGGKCLVVEIFMTFYDVHSNRVPYKAYQTGFKHIDPVKTKNMPMIATEEALFEGLIDKAIYEADYLFNNQRALTTFFAPNLGIRYFTVQLADDVVDVILNFNVGKQQRVLQSGEKFGAIRYGSGCSVIIPITDTFKVRPIIKVGDHVKGGIDAVAVIDTEENSPISYDYNEEITDESYVDDTENLYKTTFEDEFEVE